MTIRRRITIDEVEDSVDSRSRTGFPTQTAEPILSDVDKGTSIKYPEYSDEEASTSHTPSDTRTSKTMVGRTFPDLIIEIKNDYRAMAVTLTVVAILIFVIFANIEPLIYPLLTAILLNIIWFGIPPLMTVIKGYKKKR